MDAMAERLNKLRQERLAREKARIEKLRELNLKKYNQQPAKNVSAVVKHIPTNKPKNHVPIVPKILITNTAKTEASTNCNKVQNKDNRIKSAPSQRNNALKVNQPTETKSARKPLTVSSEKGLTSGPTKLFSNKKMRSDHVISSIAQNNNKTKALPHIERKSLATSRKSISVTKKIQPKTKTNVISNVSVFERLYKPKIPLNNHSTNVEKIKADPDYLKKVINQTGVILNRRHTVFNNKPEPKAPVRRSISAVHLKKVSKNELANCIHKWASIGDKLNNIDIKQVDEDETVNVDKVVSAIKSERKRVTFMTPCTNFNTPRQEELQARLKVWLQKRGKSLDSYHHLQCFGLHHLPYSLKFNPKLYEDENKENVCVESDTDDDSYTENMNDEMENKNTKWRHASIVSDSIDLNETQNTTATCSDVINTDEVVIGALTDLTELLKEGFEWMQCARWLRAVRERFPSALNSAAYWECRAALEEKRGDLPASVKCWEEAIIQGTEYSVAEANLDQLLDKFMQLQISPNGGKSRSANPKFVDVKNVFKSTIIRFAVQQAKLRLSTQESSVRTPAPRYSMTPVRRSARLSGVRTPLQLCASVRQAPDNSIFIRNKHLHSTP